MRTTVHILCALIASAIPTLAHAQGDLFALEEDAMQAAAAAVAPSVVRIETVGGLERVGRVLVSEGPTTGLVISPDGHILSSAYNFLGQPASVLVTLDNGTRKPAEIVARDNSRMLVLLKIETDEDLPVPEFAARDEIKVGSWSIALGRAHDAEGDPGAPVREVQRVADAEGLLDEHPLAGLPVRREEAADARSLEVVRDAEDAARGWLLVCHAPPYDRTT